MHTFIHYGLRIGFLIVIAVLFTVFVAVRPDAQRPLTKRQLFGVAFLGLVIGVIFLSTTSLYAHAS